MISTRTVADDTFSRLAGVFAETVGAFVEEDQPFALLDFPDHSNIGDSAIYIGELAFFDQHVKRPAGYVGSFNDDPADVTKHLPNGPVFIHGGGNFGDIWPAHQTFRIRAMEALKGRPIVQLPQSLHFEDLARADETARAIDAHGDVTLLMRDRPSFEFAKTHFDCNVLMCPDAAVNLHHLPAAAPTEPLRSFLRGDRESVWADARDMLSGHGLVTDWPEAHVWTLPIRIRKKLLNLTSATKGAAMRYREVMYRQQATARVTAGIGHIAPAKRIVTDRLHVHLMSALMRRPHVVLDNSYGKIGRHIEAWGDFGLAERVATRTKLEETLTADLPA